MEPKEPSDVPRDVGKLNWTTIALIGALVVLVLVVAYFATRGNANQDKLTSNQLAASSSESKAPAPDKLCASKDTYELIKRELFRRAAQLRGSDQAAYDRLSAAAVIRMENPVMESQDGTTQAVNCSGSLSLDLPPGVAVVGGRRTLASDVDYTVQPAADGTGNVVLLRNAEAIVTPLATLAPTAEAVPPVAQPEPAAPSEENGAVPAPSQVPPAEPSPQAPQQQSSATPPAVEHPSFDCTRARTKGEIAVCSNSGLSALDRNMAAQYVRAINQATPDEQQLLRRTRDRFLRYRDRCPSRSCVANAYVGRMREIRDIMNGTWQPPQ